jgi:hypothetical protein
MFIAVLCGGCASATLDVLHPVPVALRAVSLSIDDATRGEVSQEQQKSLRGIVAQQLRDAGIVVLPEAREDAPRVRGTILHYDEGLRLLRFVTGFGFGTGRVVTAWQVRQGRSNSIARCRIEGSVSLGTFGGSFEDVLEDTGRALARFLKGGI